MLKFKYDERSNVTRVYLVNNGADQYIGTVRGEISTSRELSTKVFIYDNIIYEDQYVKIVSDPGRSIIKK